MNETGSVLIIEDDHDLARFNARMLERCGYDAVIAAGAAEARAAVRRAKPDLLVLDIELPDGDGLALCKEFKRDTNTPVLFLTGRAKTEDRVAGLDIGGDYYLTKPYDRNEFLAVVKSLLRRLGDSDKKLVEAAIITHGTLTIKIFESKAYIDGRDAGLTTKEFAVLLLLAQNEGREFSNAEIYEKVWGTTMNNDANAVRLHISRLKKKLGENDTDDFAILTGYGKGYTFTAK